MPVSKILAKLKIEVAGQKKVEVPLFSGADISRLSLLLRLTAAFKYILWGEDG